VKVLGIDPGARVTGYGVVEGRSARLRHVAHGVLRPQSAALAARLAEIQRGLAQVIAEHGPEIAVVERVFVGRSARSALVLGQARGVALAAAAAAGMAVEELSAAQIKRAVAGSGAADKAQVQRVVTRLLALPAAPPRDAADALAAAICRALAPPLPRRASRPARPARSRRPLRPVRPLRVRAARLAPERGL